MNDEQFTQLFKYIEDFRTEVNDKLDRTASKDRLDHVEWAHKVSEKTGIPLENL